MSSKNKSSLGQAQLTRLSQRLLRSGLIGSVVGIAWLAASVLLSTVFKNGTAIGDFLEVLFILLALFSQYLAQLGLFDSQNPLTALIFLGIVFAISGFVCGVGVSLFARGVSSIRRASNQM